MAKRTINLVLEVVIEVVQWFKTKRENNENGGRNDRKRNSKEKSKG